MSAPTQHFAAPQRKVDPGLGSAWVGLCDQRQAPSARREDQARFEHAIQRDVFPHLIPGTAATRGMRGAVATHASGTQRTPPHEARQDPGARSAEAFGRLLLARDAAAASTHIERLHAGGMTPEALYLDVLAPAARHLGDLWTEDLLDFTQVTIGVGRLHQMLRALSPAFQAQSGPPAVAPQTRQALLVAAPGEQHSFGLAMVTEFFRRAGWAVRGAPSGADLTRIVRGQWFAVIGFSLADETRLDALRLMIGRVRQASKNRAVRVMVGGPVFIAHPELVGQIGADAMAVDGRQAVIQARNLVASPPELR